MPHAHDTPTASHPPAPDPLGTAAGLRIIEGGEVTITVPVWLTIALGTPAAAPAAGDGSRTPGAAARAAPTLAAAFGPQLAVAPTGDTIPLDDVAPMDVLLYRGRGILSDLIRVFDGTDASHAALYLGDATTGEALARGVVRQNAAASFAGHDWVLSRRLKSTPLPSAQPVLKVAAGYLDSHVPYAYHQLLLLAFLALTRKVKTTPVLNVLIRKILDGAAEMLNDMIGGGARMMICSEFVYRCYDEAKPHPPYDLRINELPAVAAGGARALTAAATPRRIGRGIDAESILAWAATTPKAPRRAATPAAARARRKAPRAAQPAREQLSAEIESLGAQYLHELRRPPAAEKRAGLAPARVDEEALRESIDRFAAALDAIEQHGEPGAAPARGRAAIRAAESPLDRLVRTAADFVTPGDLLKADSLYTVGRIAGVP